MLVNEKLKGNIPGLTGMAQEAIGFMDLATSTRHMRQLPAMDNSS